MNDIITFDKIEYLGKIITKENIQIPKCNIKTYSSYEEIINYLNTFIDEINKLIPMINNLVNDSNKYIKNRNIEEKSLKVVCDTFYQIYLYNLEVEKINVFLAINNYFALTYRIKDMKKEKQIKILNKNNNNLLVNNDFIIKELRKIKEKKGYILHELSIYSSKRNKIKKSEKEYNNDIRFNYNNIYITKLRSFKNKLLKYILKTYIIKENNHINKPNKQQFILYVKKQLDWTINRYENNKMQEIKLKQKEKNYNNTFNSLEENVLNRNRTNQTNQIKRKILNQYDSKLELQHLTSIRKKEFEILKKINIEVYKNIDKEQQKNMKIEDVQKEKIYFEYMLYEEERQKNIIFKEKFKEYLILLVNVYDDLRKKNKVRSFKSYLKLNGIHDLYDYLESFAEKNHFVFNNLKEKYEFLLYNIFEEEFKKNISFESFKKEYNAVNIYFKIHRYLKNIFWLNFNNNQNTNKKTTNKLNIDKQNIYAVENLNKKEIENIYKILNNLGIKKDKKIKTIIEKNIYKVLNNNARSVCISNNILLYNYKKERDLAHELGHLIANIYMNNKNNNVSTYTYFNNNMLKELHSQALEIMYQKNITNEYNLEINEEEKILEKLMLLSKYVKILETIKFQKKILNYLNLLDDMYINNYDYCNDNNNKYNIQNEIEKNIEILIKDLTDEEKRLIFLNSDYLNGMFKNIEYDFPLYFLVTILSKLNKENSEVYSNKYIYTMKNLNKISIEEILQILEVDPKKHSNELSLNYLNEVKSLDQSIIDLLNDVLNNN